MPKFLLSRTRQLVIFVAAPTAASLQGRSLVAGHPNDPKICDEACLTLTVWSADVYGSLPASDLVGDDPDADRRTASKGVY